MEELENNVIIQENYFCKSISGEEDENGNYKFEVEASNENLDLQNQITLQSALRKSEEYFVTNGVISDDHLHKTRNPDGSVETHKDKIIGEPLSVRFDPATKKTFVKGILYSGIEAAKPYIELLKSKSSRVKASIGGIMPKIKKNADGSETVTSFMWNDLALTCSPVNWTVGSAKFAKSMGVVDFCKSLESGAGADASSYEGGRALQSEDLENETKTILDIADGDIKNTKNKKEIEKADEEIEIIKSCITAIDEGELISKSDIENYLMDHNFTADNATETAEEIIKQGGIKMSKSNFSSTIDELLKSFGGEEPEDNKKKKDSENEEADNTLFDDETDDMPDEEDDVEKNCMKKSIDDELDTDYLDATELMKSMGETIDAQSERINAQNEEIDLLKKSIAEIQDNMIEVTKSFGDYLKTPNARTTVMEKSMVGNGTSITASPATRPTNADFDTVKKALVQAAKNGKVSLDEVQFYNTEFQKSMKGMKVDPKVWNTICTIVRENR